jgi:hypothetical protein
MAPELGKIPNNKGEPMKRLTLSTLPFYVKCGVSLGARTLPRVINRYTGLLGAPKQATANHLPASWVTVVLEGKHIHSIFDSSAIENVCREAASALQSASSTRTFQTMFTVELLLRAIPKVCNRVVFNVGPEIPD